jgi:hypothetical protein
MLKNRYYLDLRPVINCMLKLPPILLIASAFATTVAMAITVRENAATFDPTHAAILSGFEGKALADACGGTSTTTSQKPSPIDIGRIERQLAPLLADDLRNSGSTAAPRQYYRQYASGRLGTRRAIFINGFHESYMLSDTSGANWHRNAVIVTDGGDSYWCAIYVEDTGQLEKFKGRHFDTHVWFYGQ